MFYQVLLQLVRSPSANGLVRHLIEFLWTGLRYRSARSSTEAELLS